LDFEKDELGEINMKENKIEEKMFFTFFAFFNIFCVESISGWKV